MNCFRSSASTRMRMPDSIITCIHGDHVVDPRYTDLPGAGQGVTGGSPRQISSRASSTAARQRSSLMQKLFLRLTTTSLETLGDRHNPLNLLDTVKRTNQPWERARAGRVSCSATGEPGMFSGPLGSAFRRLRVASGLVKLPSIARPADPHPPPAPGHDNRKSVSEWPESRQPRRCTARAGPRERSAGAPRRRRIDAGRRRRFPRGDG